METNKALVLNERGHPIFFPFFLLKTNLHHQEPSLYSHRTGLQSPGNVITVRFLPRDEDWWPTLRSGQKKTERQRKRFVENQRQTLLELRLAAHRKKKSCKKPSQKISKQ